MVACSLERLIQASTFTDIHWRSVGRGSKESYLCVSGPWPQPGLMSRLDPKGGSKGLRSGAQGRSVRKGLVLYISVADGQAASRGRIPNIVMITSALEPVNGKHC